ncbi:alpha/beta fold hydrolase [Natronobacterium lacisalsi]|uniref:Alpha/beta fold family hydrolase n=1 Tax=Natronobacterium lacisalsi AJ5 TaxID=358396 RepID=M0LDB4_NATLA|nr:alpha/beta hydrolase [Halobiforma lacisalsi]EMA31547.1 alpha/beta fold family hydrolase [Halobiforma lacisalsi AJ5]
MTTRPHNPSPRGTAPFVGRTVSLDDGRQLAYAEYGCPKGVPVVFLHGTPGSRRLGVAFETIAEDLGVRLLSPDRPGYGRSSPWPDRSIDDAGEFVGALLDDADVGTAGIVGFSGGCPYALAAAASLPERIDRVDVVAGATPPDVSEATPAMQRFLAGLATTAPVVLRGLFRGQALLADHLAPSFVVDQYTAADTGEPVPDDVAEIVKADFLEAFARHRRGAVTEFRNTATDWGIDFADIDSRVHLWHGENDTNVPIEDARRLETRISTAELHVLEDADHLRTLLRGVPRLLEDYR